MQKVLITFVSNSEKITLKESSNNTDYVNIKDLLMHKVGKVMTEHLLLELGITKHELNLITTNTFGKPILPGYNVDFNVSHSNGMVVAVVSSKKSVGIDIERIREVDLLQYKEFFTSDEWHKIVDEDKKDLFFDLWTKKESLVKAYGAGLQINLKDVIISGDLGFIKNTSMQGYFNKIPIPGYACFVCSTFKLKNIEHNYFNQQGK